jgi:hypothetical protein
MPLPPAKLAASVPSPANRRRSMLRQPSASSLTRQAVAPPRASSLASTAENAAPESTPRGLPPPKVVVPSSRKLQALAQTSSPNVQGRQSLEKDARKSLETHPEDLGTPIALTAPVAVSPLITF